MKTRLDKQPLYHRFSILSDTVPKCQVSRKLHHHHRPTQNIKKRLEITKEGEDIEQDQQQRSYLEQLQKEAFDELRLQLQHYNDDFIVRMRYIEKTRDYLYKEEDDDMQELQDCFNTASVKDYSQLIESCRTETSSNMFS